MKLGFARIDITPPRGTLLCGQLEPRPARGVESRLYATALSLDDGATPVLLCSCDVLALSNQLARRIAQAAHRATGVPAGHIVVCATHTHSGPSTVAIFGAGANTAYTTALEERIVRSLTQAWRARAAGTLAVASGEVAGLAFNRRFLMSNGTIATHPLKGDPHIMRPEGPDSRQLDVLVARDRRGRPLGAAVAFACHGTVMPRTSTRISADYPGKVVQALSAKLGGHVPVLFLQGASGNICQVNPRDTSRTELGVGWARRMGATLGRRAFNLLRQRGRVAAGPLRLLTKTIMIPRRTVPRDLADWARGHRTIPSRTPVLSNYGVERYRQIKPPVVSLEGLFKTPWWANFYADEIKTRERLRAQQPALRFTITVIAQDHWALVALPCELFIEWAELIRAQSPFRHTLVVELADGWNGYVPTRAAFARAGGYETKELSSTLLTPAAGEMISRSVVKMLQQAKYPHGPRGAGRSLDDSPGRGVARNNPRRRPTT